jgi:hypothetical protein
MARVMARLSRPYGALKGRRGWLCAITALKGRFYGAASPILRRVMAHDMAQIAPWQTLSRRSSRTPAAP